MFVLLKSLLSFRMCCNNTNVSLLGTLDSCKYSCINWTKPAMYLYMIIFKHLLLKRQYATINTFVQYGHNK
ncbi:hypothetical protein XENTR_v10002371 [Xenopus tropicalis]|nr:hypothetical protein XENTR_v10002371 [Xenopus tropicalis]